MLRGKDGEKHQFLRLENGPTKSSVSISPLPDCAKIVDTNRTWSAHVCLALRLDFVQSTNSLVTVHSANKELQ